MKISTLKKSAKIHQEKLAEVLEDLVFNSTPAKSDQFKLEQSITANLPFYGFVISSNLSVTLSVLLTSGWCLEFSLNIEDLIRFNYHQFLKQTKEQKSEAAADQPNSKQCFIKPASFFPSTQFNMNHYLKDKQKLHQMHTQISACLEDPSIAGNLKLLSNGNPIEG